MKHAENHTPQLNTPRYHLGITPPLLQHPAPPFGINGFPLAGLGTNFYHVIGTVAISLASCLGVIQNCTEFEWPKGKGGELALVESYLRKINLFW